MGPILVTSPDRWFDQAIFPEPTLGQLLEDPFIRLLMTSDGVKPDDVRALFAMMARSTGWRGGREG